MLNSLTSAISGLDNFQQQMDVIGNNIANVNTVAFKSDTVQFGDTFSDTLRQASAATSTTSGVDPMQIGTGVTTTGIDSDWSAGTASSTGVASDVAITGNGFFLVRDTLSNDQYATRAGDFQTDANGYLTTQTGERIQGYSDAGLTALGDIKIDTTGEPATSDPTATVSSFGIGKDGKITVNLSDGTSFVRGQILLQNYTDPSALVKVGNNLYTGMGNAGGLAAPVAAGTSGTGALQGGAVELSNVDLSNEMANLITAQRAFEANSKLVTTSDEMLQTVVNMKR